MILATTETVPGRTIDKSLGMVRGNTVRAKHVGKDILALLRNLVGGELNEYTDMLTEARNEAINRMVEQAKSLDADAVVGVRLVTAQVASASAEMLAYGTAVKFEGGD
ncbi:MAG: YbjQ family protein [Pseudomonadota bacterium]